MAEWGHHSHQKDNTVHIDYYTDAAVGVELGGCRILRLLENGVETERSRGRRMNSDDS